MMMMMMDDSVRKTSRSNQHVEVFRLSPEPRAIIASALKIERGLLTKPFTVLNLAGFSQEKQVELGFYCLFLVRLQAYAQRSDFIHLTRLNIVSLNMHGSE